MSSIVTRPQYQDRIDAVNRLSLLSLLALPKDVLAVIALLASKEMHDRDAKTQKGSSFLHRVANIRSVVERLLWLMPTCKVFRDAITTGNRKIDFLVNCAQTTLATARGSVPSDQRMRMVMFIDVSGSMLYNAVNMAEKNFFGPDNDFSDEKYDIMAFMIKSAMKSLMHQWMRRSNVDAYLVLFGATARTFDLSCEDKAQLKGSDPASLDEWVRYFMRKHSLSIGSPVSSYGTCFNKAIECYEKHAQGRAPMVSEACFLTDAEYGDAKEEQRKFLEAMRRLKFDVVRLQVVSRQTVDAVSDIIPPGVTALVESIDSSDSTPPEHISTAALVLNAAEAVLEEPVSKPLNVTFVKPKTGTKLHRATNETLQKIRDDVRAAATGAPAAPKPMSATAFDKNVEMLEDKALHRFTIRLDSDNKVNECGKVNELTKHVLASVLAGVTAAMKIAMMNGKTYEPEVVKKIANHTDTVMGWVRSGEVIKTNMARKTSYAVFGLLRNAAPELLKPCVLDPLNDQFKLHWPNEDEILYPIKRNKKNDKKDDSAPTCPPILPESPLATPTASEPGSPMQTPDGPEEGSPSPALTPVTPEDGVPESLEMDIVDDNPNSVPSGDEDDEDDEDGKDDEPLSKRLCVPSDDEPLSKRLRVPSGDEDDKDDEDDEDNEPPSKRLCVPSDDEDDVPLSERPRAAN